MKGLPLRFFKFLGCLVILAGCSHSPQVRSEYFDVTGRIFVPKPDAEEIRMYEVGSSVDVPYEETGRVNVWAPVGTSREAIDKELKRRARGAGADALIGVQYTEDQSEDLVLFGKVLSKKKHMSATGHTAVLK